MPDLKQGQHVCLIGTTGSGKTVLAEAFLSRKNFVVAIDQKWELQWRAFKVTDSLAPILQLQDRSRQPSRWLFRPRDPQHAAAAYDALFKMRGWTIYQDEVYALVGRPNANAYPEPFLRCLTRGRSRGITVWSGMQRPRNAPWACFTESTHFFLFRLTHAEDRRHVAQFTTPELADAQPVRYGFVYYDRLDHEVIVSRPLRQEVR